MSADDHSRGTKPTDEELDRCCSVVKDALASLPVSKEDGVMVRGKWARARALAQTRLHETWHSQARKESSSFALVPAPTQWITPVSCAQISTIRGNVFAWRVELDCLHTPSLHEQLQEHCAKFRVAPGAMTTGVVDCDGKPVNADALPPVAELGVIVLHVHFPFTYPTHPPVLRLVRPMLQPMTGDCFGAGLARAACVCVCGWTTQAAVCTCTLPRSCGW